MFILEDTLRAQYVYHQEEEKIDLQKGESRAQNIYQQDEGHYLLEGASRA